MNEDSFQSYTKILIPLSEMPVSAGFPSPIEDFEIRRLDLIEYLGIDPFTKFIRVSGDSMVGSFIADGAILVIDPTRTPVNGDIIFAKIYTEFTVKKFFMKFGKVFLNPDNPKYQPIEVTEEMEFEVRGVVTNVFYQFKKNRSN